MHPRKRRRQFNQLEEGEDVFLKQARIIRDYGAAVVVMAFDEQGQRPISKKGRYVKSLRLLTEKADFPPRILFLTQHSHGCHRNGRA